MQIIPMRDLKNTVEVERLCAEEQGPIYVTKNGYTFFGINVAKIAIQMIADAIQKYNAPFQPNWSMKLPVTTPEPIAPM